MRQGVRRRAPVVNAPRAWRWSPSRERGWPHPPWSRQLLDDGDGIWFSRVAPGQNSALPPVVLIHGVVVSGRYFQPLAHRLAGDFDLYIPDLPGVGRSRSRSGFRDISQLADGLGRWMDLQSLTDAVLVSHSVGCQVLTMLATRRPELVHTLVLVAPTMDPDVSSIFGIMRRGLIDIPRERLGLWTVWLPDLLRTGPVRGIRLLRKAMRDPQLARLVDVRVPVVVVGGERDPIAPERWVTAMAGRLPCGRAIVIPGAPHAMNYTSPRRLAWIIRVAAGAWPTRRGL